MFGDRRGHPEGAQGAAESGRLPLQPIEQSHGSVPCGLPRRLALDPARSIGQRARGGKGRRGQGATRRNGNHTRKKGVASWPRNGPPNGTSEWSRKRGARRLRAGTCRHCACEVCWVVVRRGRRRLRRGLLGLGLRCCGISDGGCRGSRLRLRGNGRRRLSRRWVGRGGRGRSRFRLRGGGKWRRPGRRWSRRCCGTGCRGCCWSRLRLRGGCKWRRPGRCSGIAGGGCGRSRLGLSGGSARRRPGRCRRRQILRLCGRCGRGHRSLLLSSRRRRRFGDRATRRGRLGAGEDQHRLAGIEVVQQRTTIGLGSQARQKHRVGRIGAGIGGDVLVLVLRGRALAVTSAHLVAQVGRRGLDRLQGIDRAERWHQPGQAAAAVESAFQQLGGLHCAHGRRRGAEHHCDHPLAVARSRSHEIEAGGADEAGLHAVGAGIAPDQRVVVALHHLAHSNAGQAPVVVVFRHLANDGTRQQGDIARRGNLVVGGQAIGIDEGRLSHAQAAGVTVHQVGEVLDRPGDSLGEHHRNVVRRFHHQHLQCVVDGHDGAGAEAHLDRVLRGGIGRNLKRRVERDASFPDLAQRDVGCHQLGDGGGIPGMCGVVGVEHPAAFGFDHQQRLGLRAGRRSPRCGQGQARPHQGPCNGGSRRVQHGTGSVRSTGLRRTV